MLMGMLYTYSHVPFLYLGMVLLSLYTYRRGLWVLKNRLKSVDSESEVRSCKQLKIRQESAKIES